jgi:hypothetical protein
VTHAAADPLSILYAEGARVTARAEVWRDGIPLASPAVIRGRVDYAASSRNVSGQMTGRRYRSCDVLLAGDVPSAAGDDLAPSGSELRLWRGAVDWTGEEILEPVGRYTFDDVDVERGATEIPITGHDLSVLVTDNRWIVPYEIAASTPVGTAISDAVRSRLPGTAWLEPDLAATNRRTPAIVWGEEVENDPWRDVTDLADAAGLELTFARDGRLTLADVPDPASVVPRWQMIAGETVTYLGGRKVLHGRPYNMVVARGEPDDDTPPVVAYAEDTDPTSGSYVGRYRKPYFLTSGYITTQEQAQGAADAQLRRTAGLAETVTLSMVGHPALDVWQALEIVDPALGVAARYVIDAVTLPLPGGPATVKTRRRSA